MTSSVSIELSNASNISHWQANQNSMWNSYSGSFMVVPSCHARLQDKRPIGQKANGQKAIRTKGQWTKGHSSLPLILSTPLLQFLHKFLVTCCVVFTLWYFATSLFHGCPFTTIALLINNNTSILGRWFLHGSHTHTHYTCSSKTEERK